jgi:predicted RNA-binding Zn-ribbon protein involved in translation (DUF1610 family)
MKNNQTTFVKACLARLVPDLIGLTITGGAVDPSGEYWGFRIEGKQNGKIVKKVIFVLADPEGNGPGFLEIQDEPAPAKPMHTEWCPACAAEAPYRANAPFPCPVCGEDLLPCEACCAEHGADGVDCGECPWEAKGKEVIPCLQH